MTDNRFMQAKPIEKKSESKTAHTQKKQNAPYTFSPSQTVRGSGEVQDYRKITSEAVHTFYVTKPVFFVGFMGAGKTSVSRRLARRCHIASVDLDSYIQRSEGIAVSEIFATQGEEAFRVLECKTLEHLSQGEALLVSCGGGIVVKEKSRELLKEHGFVVYLQVSADEAASRISDTSTRPLFSNLDAARKTIADRLPLYEEVADAVIDTSGKSIDRITSEVKHILLKEGILWQTQK